MWIRGGNVLQTKSALSKNARLPSIGCKVIAICFAGENYHDDDDDDDDNGDDDDVEIDKL